MPTMPGSFADAVASGAGFGADGDTNQPTILKAPNETVEPPVKEVVKEVVKEDQPVKEEVKKEDVSNPNFVSEEVKVDPKKDEIFIPKGLDAKAITSWKGLHKKVEESSKSAEAANARAEAAEAKLTESQKTPPELESLKKELEATKARLAENEGEIYISRVESSAPYKQKITAPLAEISTSMQEVAKRYDIPESGLMEAIREPDRAKRAEKISEAIVDFNELDRDDVKQAAREYHRLNKEAEEMRKDAGTKLSEIERQTKEDGEKQSAQTAQSYRRAAQSEWSKLQETIPTIRRTKEDSGWNKYLDSIGNEIEAFDVNDVPVEEVAKMLSASKVLPELVKSVDHLQTQLKTEREAKAALEKKLAAYIKSAPGAGGGHNGHESPNPNPIRKLADGFPISRV